MNINSLRAIRLGAMALALTGLATSCSSDDPGDKKYLQADFDFNFPNEIYNKDGYWADVYSTDLEDQSFYVSSINANAIARFSHSADATEWDGVTYHSYTGFCPSRVNDNTDHSAENWVDFQWAAMAESSTTPNGYLIAHWDVNETLEKPSCSIIFGSLVVPRGMYVTNTAWGYWAMKNGSAFSRPFGPTDRFTLIVHGVKDGVETGQVSVNLAADGQIVDKWIPVDLSSLGECGAIYFTMTSTDSGQWGMNNPAYFALENLSVTYLTNN